MVRLRTLALAVLAFFWSSSLLTAQSVLQFPRAISSSGVFTGLAVGNPTTTQASVTFVAYQADGTLLAGGAQNPVTVIIPAGGQYARLIPEIFGPANFNGWIQATSSTSGLTGFFLNGNSALTDFDGAGSRSPGTDFVLPIAVEDSTARTEVTLLNVNVDAAVVTVTLYANDGRVIVAKDIPLAARSLARQTLVNLLGAVDFSTASHLTLRANRPIIAHEVVADFQIPGTSLRRETAALSGHALTSAVSHVLPQFATGGNWTSVVGLVNGSNAAQDVTLTAYKEDGTLWSVPSNPKTVTLPGNGGMRDTVENLFGFPSGTLNSGWILVSPSQGSLATYIGYGNNLTPSFALVEGAETNAAARFSVFSQVAEGAGYYTGLTVVNPGPAPADIEFYTLRADGSSVGRTTLTLAPNQKVARLFRELLPVSFQQVEGWGFVRASSPVVAAVLFGSSNGYALASVPQQIPAGDFIPPAQTTGAITGVVRSGGQGLADVQVTLSGPVNTTITTESSGQFVFSRLPAGQYKVTPSRIGAVISPIEQNVTIDRQNVQGVDFNVGAVTAANSPVIDFISPLSAFAGNSPLSIRVFGKNFTPASVIRVNNQPVPTSFVSAVELSAVIPASNLTQPATLKVFAETPPPGGGVSGLADFTVNPVPSNPLIEGSAAVGSFPAGVAIDASRRRALITNESGDSVTVLDLVTRQTVTEIHVGRSPGEGIDIHPAKDIALVANVGTNDVSVIDLKTNTVTQTIKVGRGPLGLAVNPDTNRAYVVNGDDNNVTIINLDTMSAAGTMATGSRPSNIAVNTRTNQAIVSNRGGNSITVLNLATGTGSTVSVGQFPRGVAINPDTNLGVVANAGDDSISIVDLTANTAVTVKVGIGPTGVAIHRGTNSVLVTNSGVNKDNPGLGNASTVSIINLDTREEVASVAAGSAAYGVGVDQDRQMAAVANFGSNNVTIFRIPNPVPKITGVAPKTFPTGGGSFTVTVKGSGFVATSVITLNRQALATVFVSSTELRGVVTAAMVDQLLQVHSIGTGNGKPTVAPAVQTIEFNIEVTNPGPGGGSNLPNSDPQTTQIQPQNLVPTLLSLSPTQTQAGAADLTLTLSGNNFNATSIVNFGGSQYSPTSSSLQSMTVVIPKAQLVAGVFPVSVTNPGPTGGLSALLSFTVTAVANPGPIVTTVTPSSVLAGSGAVTVVVQGTGFINSTTGTLAGVPGVLSGGTMSFPVPAGPTAVVGTLNGFIVNPAPGGGTATFSVNVLNPAPTVSGFAPTSAGVGAPATSLQITGTNFVASSQVTFGGTPIATGFVSSTVLTATISSALLTASGSFAIDVTNPGPGGGSGSGGNFAVLPIPTLSSISPGSGTQGTTVNVTLTGTNLVPAATTINVSGGGISIGQIVSAGTTGLSMSFTIDATATPGSRSVTVTTSAGTSNAVSFNVVLAPPTISSINPPSGTQGSAVGVTLTGTNFVAGSTVSINSADVAVGNVTVVNTTTITATFTISPTATTGARSVAVSNSAGNSNAVGFTVLVAQPTLSSINPSSGTQGTSVNVTLTGTNFLGGASVSIGGGNVTVGPVTVVDASTITTTFTIGSAAAAGARSVTVFTSAGSSNAVSFTVLAAAPTLSSINPNSGNQGAAVNVTLTGTNFTGGATVSINSVDVTVGTVAVVNSTTITTTFTISSAAAAGARSVTVTTSGGTSGAATFTVIAAGPTLSSINPNSGTQGTAVNVTLTGTNFTGGATVSTNSVDVTVGTVTVVNSTTITTTFTISTAAAAGARNVTVTTSAGTSGAATFTVIAAGPTLSSINPNSGTQGTAVNVTLTGTNFTSGATVSTNSADVTVGTVTVVNSTTITTTFTISSAAAAGARNVTVTTSAGTSGAATFTVVTAAGPALSSINPSSGLQGDVVPVTLSGANFLTGATVAVSGTGVAVSAVNVVNPTTLTATFTISSLAASGVRNVTVTTSAGTSGAVTFTVTPGADLVTGFSAAANPGGVWSYGFTPTLGGALTLYDSNAADTSLPAGFQRWFATALGADPAVVRNNTGANYTHTNSVLFPANMLHIHPGPNGQYSVIRWTAPAAGVYAIQGFFMGLNPHPTTTDVHVRHNSTFDLFNANINNYNLTSPYSVNVSVLAGDTIDFEVGFGSNLDYAFDSTGVAGTITPLSTVPAPTLSAVNPSSGAAGTTTTVTLTGTNFVTGGTTVAVSGSGVTVGAVNVIDSTSLTASLTLAPGAATGARNVTVTTSGGTSGSQIFTVNLVAPTLTSVAPVQGVQGTTLPVTLTGTDFIAGASVAINSTDVTVGPVTVVSPTSITTTLTIASTAVLGIRNVTVTTGGGTSNAQVFTVQMAGPVSWWRGEGNVLDTLGANNPSSSNAVSFVPATFGTGFTFGSGGFIDIPQSASLANQQYTLSAWVRPNGPGPNNDVAGNVIINENIDNTHALLVSWRALDGRFFFQFGTADGASLVSTNSFPTGQFYLVDATYDGSTFKLFVNGNLEAQQAGPRAIIYSTNAWTIGAASPNIRVQSFPRTWNGVIDEVQVFSRALSTSEIQAQFSALSPPTLLTISPGSGAPGQTVPITLTGTNFQTGATTVAISGTGVSVGAVTVASATSLTTTFAIASGAALTSRNVTVTTAGGTSASVLFDVVSTFPGSVFSGATSTDWSDPANWQPAGVPTVSTSVLIPVAATRQPTLTANAFVLNLTVENGATLNTAGFNLTVAGNVDAGTTITGTGTVVMSGTGTIKGTLPNVQVTGTAAFAAGSTATINGNLTVSSGTLDLADATVAVIGNFTTNGSGQLKMLNAAGVLTVNGNVTFQGGNEDTLLTAGVLNVKGNFAQTGASSGAGNTFNPTGTHRVVFNGGAAQTISFTHPASDQGNSHFQNLEIANTSGGVSFLSTTQINGNLDVTTATTVSGNVTLFVSGNVSTAAGSNINVTTLSLSGTAALTGSLSITNLVVNGSVTLNGATTLTGNLTISSGSVDISDKTLTVTGNFTTNGSGQLKMQNAAGVLTVTGDVTFQGGNEDTLLTAGVLNVKGNFAQVGASSGAGNTFNPTGTHRVVFNGGAAQTINFTNPATDQGNSHFQNLEIANTNGGVSFTTHAYVNGNLDVTTGTIVTGNVTVFVSGNVSTAAGSNINVTTLTLSGTAALTGAISITNLVVAGGVSVSGATTLTGNLTISSGSVDISDKTLTVTGNFTTNGSGQLKMQNAAGVLTVNGNVTFQGGNEDTLLTAGVLNVKGNFAQAGASSGAGNTFNPTGTHRVVFNGGAAQTINFSNPASDQGNSHFQNLEIANTSGGVSFLTVMQINGNLDVTTATLVSGSVTVFVSGNVSTAVGSNINVTTLTLSGTTALTGANSITNLVITGGVTVNAATTLTGNLTISSGSLDISDKTLTVAGNFTTNGSGQVKMQNAAGVLTVNGNVTFQGGNEDTLLTAGVLNVKGNFAQVGASSGAGNTFNPTGTHRVVFNGGAAQTINFTNPASDQGNSHFQNLQIANTSGGASFLTTTQINGNLDVSTATTVTGNVTVLVSGNVSTAAGSNINVTTLTLSGTAALTGANSITNLVITGGVTVNAATTLTGNLTISSGSLDISDKTLTVAGNFTTNGSGQVKMQNPAGGLTVNGNVLFQGGNEDTLLTAGVLNVKGNFAQAGASSGAGNTFNPTGTHRVVFNGGAAQTISFNNPASDQGNSHFQNLEIANTSGGVSFLAATQINGNLDVTTATTVSGNVTVTVNGNLTTLCTSTISVTNLTVLGTTTTLCPAARTWVGGTPGNLTDWATASNWSPSGQPTATQSVQIPVTANQPVLTANAVAGDLTLDAGAILSTSSFTITVSGNLSGGSITGPGNVVMNGSSKAILGVVPNLSVTGTVAAGGSLTVIGNLTASSGTFDVNGRAVVVTGNFSTAASGVLKMQDAAGVLSVNGATLFGGGDTTGVLTAGTLNAKGNFTSNSSSLTNFAASGTHLTVLNGTSAQTVSFNFPSATNNRFQNLQLSNTAGAVFSTDAQINGNFDVTVAASVSGPDPLTILGNLTTAPGSTVTTFSVILSGAMNVGGSFAPGTARFAGTGQTIQAGLGYLNVAVSGTAAFSGATTVTGNLNVFGGSLDLAGMAVTVTGNFSTTSGGVLKMQNAAGVLTVNGATTFGGGDTTGLLTAGTLNVKGTFAASSSSLTNFAASGTHLTVLNGTAAQTVIINFPGATNSRFQNLRLGNIAGAVFTSNAQINGNFDVAVAAGVSGAGTITVAGNLTTPSGSTVTVSGVKLEQAMTIGGTFAPSTTTFAGITQIIQAGLGYQNVVVTGTAAFSGATTVTGDLTVSGGAVDLAGTTVTVTGNFTTTASGVLKMQNAAGVLRVNGATLFAGGDTTGLLTAGTLNVKGSFTSNSSSLTNFAASGAHLTMLDGTSSQTVSMSFPSSGNNRFQNLALSNPAGAVFSTNAQINGNFDVTVAANVTGGGTVTVVGNLTTASGATVATTGMTLNGALTVGGPFTPVTTTFVGTSQTIPGGLGYQNVIVTGTAAFAGATTVTGDLTVSGGSLDLAGTSVTVTGNFTTTANGVLKMQNAAGVLTVNGATLFAGGNTTGLLTAGTLNVKGSFTSNTSSLTNFAASGTHLTVLNGAAAQTVSMSFPSPTNNRFQNLQLSQTAGVVFSTNAQINGNFNVTVFSAVSGAGTVTVAGTLTTPASSSVTTAGMTLGGAMTIGGTFSPTTTTFTGTNQTIQAGLGYKDVVVTGTAAFASTTTVNGNLTVSVGAIDLAGATVTVTGNFLATANGVLKMQNSAGVLTINGVAQFSGGDTTGLLTAGTLNLKGNFISDTSSLTNFAPSGTHLTVLNGTVSQLVSTIFPGATNNRFQNLRLANTAGAVFSTNTQVNGNFDVTAAANVSGGGTITIVGALTTPSGSAVTTAGMTLGGAMSVNGTFTPQLTTFAGTNQTIQAGLGYQNVTITGTAAFPVSQFSIPIFGDLTVVGGQLDVAAGTAVVAGNFTTTGGGLLKMQNSSGFLQVSGNAIFNGGDTSGLLTNGTLYLQGNFSSTSSSLTNFAPSGAHLTVFGGTATQTLNVAFPGSTNNRFRDLLVTNTVGVSLLSNAIVTGEFDAGATSPKVKIIGNGKTLTVANIDANGLDLDHVLLVINWNLVGPMYFDYVDLRNYPDAATRITITATAVPDNLFSGINFVDGVPVAGRLVNATDTNGGGDFLLLIESNLNPALADAKTVKNGGAAVIWYPQPVTYSAPVNYNVGTFPRSVEKADFNGDGKLDLVVANRNSDNVSILLGNGNGTFQNAVSYITGPVGRAANNPRFVKAGDFNLDGKVDLAVANENTGDIGILLGNGNGTFQAAVVYATGSGAAHIDVGDFNGDGKPDLVVVNTTGDTVSTLLGNGNGTFQAALNFTVGIVSASSPQSVVVSDFDGDGKKDLVVTLGNNNGIRVYLGNGNGTFQSSASYAAGNFPNSLVTADFNADGKADLAVANQNDDTVKVYFGNGNGTFQAGIPYSTGSSPRFLTVGDFNGDGVPDLATADCGSCIQGTDSVSVLLGNGNGTFNYPYQFPVGTAPFAVVGGDFNGDGKPDLAVANRGSNNVSILLWTAAVP